MLLVLICYLVELGWKDDTEVLDYSRVPNKGWPCPKELFPSLSKCRWSIGVSTDSSSLTPKLEYLNVNRISM